MKIERVGAILSSQVENTASNSEFWPRLGPISPLKNATCDITMTQEVALGLIGIKKKEPHMTQTAITMGLKTN